MSGNMICMDMEVRKLRPAELYTLGQILNISDSWKKLMAIVPKEGSNNCPKFNSEHFSMIEQAVQQQRRNAAEIFLEEWGTMGRRRPTLRTLLDLLVKAELFRAADYIAGDILNEELPERPKCGPAAAVDISDETIEKLLKEQAVSLEDKFDHSSLLLGSSSELNVNKVVYFTDNPVECINISNKNMQSTKLASTNQNVNEGYIGMNLDIPGNDVSNLMKFSTDEINKITNDIHNSIVNLSTNMNACNIKSNAMADIVNENVYLPACMYGNREILTQELPLCLNESKEPTIKQTGELKSHELPACLNSTFISGGTTDSSCSTSHTEVSSAELPQCLVEHESKEHQTTPDNVLTGGIHHNSYIHEMQNNPYIHGVHNNACINAIHNNPYVHGINNNSCIHGINNNSYTHGIQNFQNILNTQELPAVILE